MEKIKELFKKHLFPMIYNTECEKKMKSKEEKLAGYDSDDLNEYNFEYIIFNKDSKLDLVKEAYDSSISRMKQFEEKAKTNLVAITISVPITFGLIKPISDIYDKYDNVYLKVLIFFISILVVSFMLYGGVISLGVLMDKNRVYNVGLRELSEDGESHKNIYGMYGELNEIINTIRNNSINTSYRCMKNSLILLSIIFLIGIIPIQFSSKEENQLQKDIKSINSSVMELKDKNIKYEAEIEEQKDKIDDLEKNNVTLQFKLKEIEDKQNNDNKR